MNKTRNFLMTLQETFGLRYIMSIFDSDAHSIVTKKGNEILNKMDAKRTIRDWQELKEAYKEEVEMGNDIELHAYLISNAEMEIKTLKYNKEIIEHYTRERKKYKDANELKIFPDNFEDWFELNYKGKEKPNNKDLELQEIPEPVGKFIINNAKGIEGNDGVYYHFSEVCKLLNKYKNDR